MRRPCQCFVAQLAMLLVAGLSPAALGYNVSAAQKYTTAQVLPIAVQSGVTISDSYIDGMQVRIAKALEESGRFTKVIQSGDANEPEASTVKIASTVIRFAPGNRAARALVPGAGATKITVHVVFSDAATNKVIVEQDVRGLIWYGGAIKGFGNPNSAQKDVSKHIEDIARKTF